MGRTSKYYPSTAFLLSIDSNDLLPLCGLYTIIVKIGIAIAEADMRDAIIRVVLDVVVHGLDNGVTIPINNAYLVLVCDNNSAILVEVRGTEVYVLDDKVPRLILEAYTSLRNNALAVSNKWLAICAVWCKAIVYGNGIG